MNLRDAETGKVLWQGTEDLSVPGVEHEGTFTHQNLCLHTNTCYFNCLLKQRHVTVNDNDTGNFIRIGGYVLALQT